MINSGNFVRYDYGESKNKKKYGQKTPPAIPLENIKDIPVALFTGSLDDLADTKDTAWLKEQVKETLIFDHQYRMGHVSFLIGKDMSWFELDAMYLF
jgi:hypothetical protein